MVSGIPFTTSSVNCSLENTHRCSYHNAVAHVRRLTSKTFPRKVILSKVLRPPRRTLRYAYSNGSRLPGPSGRTPQPPVHKEAWFAPCDAGQPLHRPGVMATQPRVLPHGPTNEMLVEASEYGIQHGLVEAPIIVEPPLHVRVEHSCKVREERFRNANLWGVRRFSAAGSGPALVPPTPATKPCGGGAINQCADITAAPAGRPRKAHTVYECNTCGTRLLGEQRCECGTFMRRLGYGGISPCCAEPGTFDELIDTYCKQRQ